MRRTAERPTGQATDDPSEGRLLTGSHGVSGSRRSRVRRQPAPRLRAADVGRSRLLPPPIRPRGDPARACRRSGGRGRTARARLRQPAVAQPALTEADRQPRGRARRDRRRPKTRGCRARSVRALATPLSATVRRRRARRRAVAATDRGLLRRPDRELHDLRHGRIRGQGKPRNDHQGRIHLPARHRASSADALRAGRVGQD